MWSMPLKSVLRTADYTRRIVLWNTILGAFDIKYMPRGVKIIVLSFPHLILLRVKIKEFKCVCVCVY